MSTEEKKYLDLGPFWPRKPLATPPDRADGASVSSTTHSVDDMATGSSIVGEQAVVPSKPPIEQLPDTKTATPRGSI